jgi:hypothetical protein
VTSPSRWRPAGVVRAGRERRHLFGGLRCAREVGPEALTYTEGMRQYGARGVGARARSRTRPRSRCAVDGTGAAHGAVATGIDCSASSSSGATSRQGGLADPGDVPREPVVECAPMLLYRPVGLNELRLMYQADLRGFPPRLPEQPIFYPVLNEGYARKIARDWNTKSETHAGFVTRFSLDDAYGSRFDRRVVGSREHEELWVPAEELADFNGHLEGPIQVIGAYFGEAFAGEIPEQFALKGKNACEQLVALAGMLTYNAIDTSLEVVANHNAVFLNFYYWEQHDLATEGIGAEERDVVLDFVRRSWASGSRAGLPLGVLAP